MDGPYRRESRAGNRRASRGRCVDCREWGVRANRSLRSGDTPIDRQFETTAVGSLALDYQGERFRNLGALTSSYDKSAVTPVVRLVVRRSETGRRNASGGI